MRLPLLAVIVLVIFTKSTEQGAALEDDNPDDLEDNHEDQIDLVNTAAWEEYGETILDDESYLKGNESFEASNATTIQYSLPKKGESQTERPEILDPDECGDPPAVKNALLFEEKQIRYEVGAKVTYACEFGYITDGSVHFSECILSDETHNLYWTLPDTRCSPRSCGDPGYVAHARRVGSVFTFPNKVSFDCDDGYALRGYDTRYCQTSGTWSGNLPTCEPIFCEPPENPENGKVSYSSLGYEAELHYECEAGFILKNDQGRICSANGKWTGNEPICLEAQCDPPVAPEHGTVQIIGVSVGSRALYTCDEGRVLSGSASSRCLDIGEWTFPTPKCLEPCFAPKVEHGKIGRYVRYNRRRTFRELAENSNIEDGEELYLRCEPNYEPFGKPETEEKITCSHGEWEAVPVCKPAMCRGPPPPTLNANVARANRTHGGGVVYHCRQHAEKTKYGSVQCNFGSWKGVTPVCTDLRCSTDDLSFPGLIKGKKKFYLPRHMFIVSCESGFTLTKENNQLKCMDGTWQGHLPPCLAASCNPEDLVEREGIIPEDDKRVLNGEYLKGRCREGYSPSEYRARCSRGQWIVTGKLCQESSCKLHRINNGRFSERVEKKRLNWSLTFDRSYEYPKVFGTRNPGSWAYVSCADGYTFQGEPKNHVSVKCSEGKWDPDPVCLIPGTPYRKEAKVPSEKVEKSNTQLNTLATRNASTTNRPLILTTEQKNAEPDGDLHAHEDLNPTPHPPCYCTYRSVDDNLVAFAGSEQLSYGTKVKNNCTIKFHCLHFGYSRINGPSEVKCENCRSWHSSEFPECAPPSQGDTILQFEGDYTILPGGIVGVQEGKRVTIRCASNGIEAFPKLATTVREKFQYFGYTDREGRYFSVITISDAHAQHNGRYLCRNEGYRPSAFAIQVISPTVKCSKFDDTDFTIHYDKGQAVNSTAIFFCRAKHKKLLGPNIIICLSNGEWSGDPPKCQTPTCPMIAESEGMAISYTNNLEPGSIAAFHCLEPRIRSGVSRATCRDNGEWSDPPASCTLSSCSLDQLFEIVPENVVPVMDDVKSDTFSYNFSLRLTCENDMMLSGLNVAKCGKDGLWQVSKVQCVIGCGLPDSKNSELIIEPQKNFYRFGESVSLSCNPGYVLSSDVVRLMCLGTSWSESVPGCLKE